MRFTVFLLDDARAIRIAIRDGRTFDVSRATLVVLSVLLALPLVIGHRVWPFALVSFLVFGIGCLSIAFQPGLLTRAGSARYDRTRLRGLNLVAPSVLALYGLAAYSNIDWEWIFAAACIIGLLITILLSRPWRSRRRGRVGTAFFEIFGLSYGVIASLWSGLVFANDMGQSELTAMHRVRVESKSLRHVTKAGWSYQIRPEGLEID